jgi:ketosteroid isomerase-like protein
MNRSALALFAMVVVVTAISGCQPAAPETNRNAATATASPAKEAFNSAAIQAAVEKAERDWFKAGETYDVEAIKRLVADDAVLVYPDGSTGTKADEVRIAETKAVTGSGFEMIDPKVTVLSADSAFITGRSRVKSGQYKDATMKKAVDISGEYRFLDLYARRNGNWQVIASQATKVMTPAP